MHGGIEGKSIVAVSVRIVLIQHAVSAEKADMLPGLKIDQPHQVPGYIRPNAETAKIQFDIHR